MAKRTRRLRKKGGCFGRCKRSTVRAVNDVSRRVLGRRLRKRGGGGDSDSENEEDPGCFGWLCRSRRRTRKVKKQIPAPDFGIEDHQRLLAEGQRRRQAGEEREKQRKEAELRKQKEEKDQELAKEVTQKFEARQKEGREKLEELNKKREQLIGEIDDLKREETELRRQHDKEQDERERQKLFDRFGVKKALRRYKENTDLEKLDDKIRQLNEIIEGKGNPFGGRRLRKTKRKLRRHRR